MPPRTMAKRSHSKPRIFPPTMPAIVAQEPSSAKDRSGDAGEIDGDEGEHVGQRDERDRDHHCQRVGALRPFDFAGDGRGVVPAHVVPHRDEDAAEEAEARPRRARRRALARVRRGRTARARREGEGRGERKNRQRDPADGAHAGRFTARSEDHEDAGEHAVAGRRRARATAARDRGRRASDRSPCRRCWRRARATPPESPRNVRGRGGPTRSSRLPQGSALESSPTISAVGKHQRSGRKRRIRMAWP